MICEHKRIRSTNCELFCMDCGEKLPKDFIVSVNEPQNGTGADDQTSKSSSKKKTVKTAAKGGKNA